MSTHPIVNRRDLLKAGAAIAGGLVIGFEVFAAAGSGARAARGPVVLQNWVRIGIDGSITLLTNATEMGQGSQSALAQILAEELEVDWDAVRLDWAPIEPDYYGVWEAFMTGGSGSVRGMFDRLRTAGATARSMLVTAAAQRMNASAAECDARSGRVTHRSSGRSLSYGDLAEAAAALPAPKDVVLKSDRQWQLIGKTPARLDMHAKVTGRAVFGIDVDADLINRGRSGPGKRLSVATIAQCPVLGGKLVSVDDAPALAIAGVRRVVRLEKAVAVVAQDYWSAQRGLAALHPNWEFGAMERASSDALSTALHAAAAGDGRYWKPDGSTEAAQRSAVEAVFAKAARVVERIYEAPLLAHATLEPMNATAEVADGRATLWLPTQVQSGMRTAVAKALDIDPAAVSVHTTFLGGGFGRRLKTDYGIQAALIAREVGEPVKLIWSREEDMQHGHYRPTSVMRLQAALSADGRVLALRSSIGCVDSDEPVSGLVNLPYSIDTVVASYAGENPGVPLGAWRSVDPSQNTFALESFVDEIAAELKTSPLALRRKLLANDARALRVLDAAVAAANKVPLEAGRARGAAFLQGFESLIAQVAEVSVAGNRLRVHRVFAAVDCGTAINPRNIESQIQGGIHFGLTAALFGAITIKQGRVQEANFDSYPLLRLDQAPDVSVVVLESRGAKVGGIGEPPVPPIAPAVCNAIAAATGVRHRTLPLARAGLTVG
ncbi:MAG: molybdopterin cofactor-binding domain-containing protein [Steroidobacteraceae bacterium]